MKYYYTLAITCMISMSIFAQRGTLSGQITDTNGESVIGASIYSTSTQIGTITDVDGNYNLRLPSGKQSVTISYVGFGTKIIQVTITPGQISTLNVILEEDAIGLSEVVVLGTRANDRLIINSPVPVATIIFEEDGVPLIIEVSASNRL